MPSKEQIELNEPLHEVLEAALVKMFRLCQSLLALVKEERQILVDGKANNLEPLTNQKGRIIEELSLIETQRTRVSDELAKKAGKSDGFGTLSELIRNVKLPNENEVVNLQEGILALQIEIKEINTGNFALASLNLQHVEAVQDYLLNLVYTPSVFYGPPTGSKHEEQPQSWNMDHQA